MTVQFSSFPPLSLSIRLVYEGSCSGNENALANEEAMTPARL